MPKLDPRPIYNPPEVLRLNEIQQGRGQLLCNAGSNPGTDCNPSGSGANGACVDGGGVTSPVCNPGSVGRP